jgi:hypothetical protein
MMADDAIGIEPEFDRNAELTGTRFPDFGFAIPAPLVDLGFGYAAAWTDLDYIRV